MIRLAIRVPRADAELLLAELLELAPSGVEEVDVGGDSVEYAVYGAPGEGLPALGRVRAAAGDALIEVISEEVAEDWAERWRAFHQPIVVGGRLGVRPPWAPPQAAELDLVIDPGQAFGTGSHPTTRLCLELLLGLDRPKGGFVDLGCGSGVLAIAAVGLGFVPVLALDLDPAAIEATRENASRNGVELAAAPFDVRSEPLPEAPTATANLVARLLLEWVRRGEPLPERVIASGLLDHEGDQVAEAFADRGLIERERRAVGGGWRCCSSGAASHEQPCRQERLDQRVLAGRVAAASSRVDQRSERPLNRRRGGQVVAQASSPRSRSWGSAPRPAPASAAAAGRWRPPQLREVVRLRADRCWRAPCPGPAPSPLARGDEFPQEVRELLRRVGLASGGGQQSVERLVVDRVLAFAEPRRMNGANCSASIGPSSSRLALRQNGSLRSLKIRCRI